MNPGIEFYEQIMGRIVLGPNAWSGGTDYALFKHDDSLHSFTQAYGRPQARYACWCGRRIRAVFRLDEVRDEPSRRSRYLLKIVAAWHDWRKAVHPVRIAVNEAPVYDGPFFLENVLAGWPAQYITLSSAILREGDNAITIKSGSGRENTLLLAGVEILRQPDLVDFTVHSVPEVAAVGDPFWVRLHLMSDHPEIRTEFPSDKVEFLGREGPLFRFRALKPADALSIRFSSGDLECVAVLDHVLPARQPGRVPLWIGMDGDDVRHDSTGEMDRVLSHFIYSGLGNYMGFRAGFGRNACRELRPDREHWQRWVRQCREHGVRMHLSGVEAMLDGYDVQAEAGDCFAGYQFHEPYLVFQPRSGPHLMTRQLQEARNLLEKKEAYVDYLRGRLQHTRQSDAAVYSGEPSLTCIYSAEAGVDGLLCEPVSNVSLLYGAARGTGVPFGAHIPADWYFGYPHDERALRRLQLAVWLAYAYGGRVVYIESAVFKTNAHDRNDWEDPYCAGVRRILREGYRFSLEDERVGAPVVPLALVYGNLESMFWMDDDRIPEMVDTGDWDRRHWGLPGATPHRRLWNASEAWLPRVSLDDPRKESLTRMFTGTPYGPVDVVTPTKSLLRYRAVAFLGWNTMTEDIYANLLSFVRVGGTLFLCGCHLDTRIELTAAPAPIFGGKVSELVGAEIDGPGNELLPGIRSCSLRNVTAKKADEHFLVHAVGEGKVYFGDFYDYPTDVALIDRIAKRLRTIGEDIRAAAPVNLHPSSPFVHYSLWQHEQALKVYAVNTDWRNPEVEAMLTACDSAGEHQRALRGRHMAVMNLRT